MKGHQPKIKKLSTAIRHGSKMAKERGIEHATGGIMQVNYKKEILCACALGLAAIGKYGVEKAGKMGTNAYSALEEDFTISKPVACLVKAIHPKLRELRWSLEPKISEYVISHNDTAKLSPEEIATRLEKCGL